jgi:ribulose-5-phosphate 4-epimerase/fuculose-1-phosphate aldolase
MGKIKKLIELSNMLSKYVVGAEGNVSCKSENGFYIKASGKSLLNLTKDDIVFVDKEFIDSNYKNSLKPSIETAFHSWIYKNTDAEFISHTHPINTLKILCSQEIYNFSKLRLFPDQVVFNGIESCVVDYYHPGDELVLEIEKSFNEFIKKNNKPPKLILLKNHGIITFGKTINECIISTDICEKSADIFLGSLFNPNYLSDIDIYKIENDEKEKYRQKI